MNQRTNSMAVSIVEDDVKFRYTLARLIDSAEDFHCVSQHPDAENALKELPISRPQVVLMDINLPGMSGIDCVSELKKILPEIQVVMLTVYENASLIFKALSHGAIGYLLKQSTSDQILKAIRDVQSGGSPMSSQIARKVVASFQTRAAGSSNYGRLSPREQQVLEQLAQGLSYLEISKSLNISFSTVRTHIRHIYEKLHVQSGTQAVNVHYEHVQRSRPDVK